MTANVGANIGAASPEAALAAPAPADGSESESESEWSESAEAEAAALFGPCGGGGGGEEEEDGREEAASDWLRRSRTALAEALADPPSDADYVLFGRGFGGRGADSLAAVASAEFFSGSGPGTGAGPAGEALARFEAAEGRRRRWKEARGGGGGGSGIPSILRSVRRGTGLGFVDAALAVAAPAEASSDGAEGGRELKRKQKQKRKRKAGTGAKPQPVLEVAGPAGAGKTALLLTLAANYVACTGTGCYLEQEGPDLDLDLDWAAYGLGGGKGTGAAAEGAADPGLLPAAVILDSELGVRPEALVAAVRAAVLRRWGETARTRAELGGRSGGGGEKRRRRRGSGGVRAQRTRSRTREAANGAASRPRWPLPWDGSTSFRPSLGDADWQPTGCPCWSPSGTASTIELPPSPPPLQDRRFLRRRCSFSSTRSHRPRVPSGGWRRLVLGCRAGTTSSGSSPG